MVRPSNSNLSCLRRVPLIHAHSLCWSCTVFAFFFFSSRSRHTRFKCDWISDVCSSDLTSSWSFSMVNGPAQSRTVGTRQKLHDEVATPPDPTAEERAGQHGSDQDGKRHGAEKGKGHRPGHRPKQPALHTLQGKDGHVGGDDDGDGGKDRALGFMARPLEGIRGGFRQT